MRGEQVHLFSWIPAQFGILSGQKSFSVFPADSVRDATFFVLS
jgi:hypothetical protein